MAIQQPSQSLERLALIDAGLSPLRFANLIDSAVQRLHDVKSIQHQSGIGAMPGDGADVSVAHVTAACRDPLFLIIAELGIEEFIS